MSDNKEKDIEDVLRSLIKERGKELYKKENANKLKSLLSDFAVKFSKERKFLNMVIDEGIQEKLLGIDNGANDEKHYAAVSCRIHLTEELGLAENRATEAVNILAAGLGWEAPLTVLAEERSKTKQDFAPPVDTAVSENIDDFLQQVDDNEDTLTTFSSLSPQFTPSNYNYTPSSNSSVNQHTTKKHSGWISIALTLLITFICVFSFFHFYIGDADTPVGSYALDSITNDGKTENAKDYKRSAKFWKKMGAWEGTDYSLGKLALHKDGTGIMTIKGESRDVTWNEKAIILSKESYAYTFGDNKLTIVDDPTLVFVAKKNIWIVIGILLIIVCLISISNNKNHIVQRNILIITAIAIIGFAIINP